MKKIIIALLLIALPVAAIAADLTISNRSFFNVGNKRACVATLTCPNEAYSTGYGLSPGNLGLDNVHIYTITCTSAAHIGWQSRWDYANSNLELYYYDNADTSGVASEAGADANFIACTWQILAIGN